MAVGFKWPGSVIAAGRSTDSSAPAAKVVPFTVHGSATRITRRFRSRPRRLAFRGMSSCRSPAGVMRTILRLEEGNAAVDAEHAMTRPIGEGEGNDPGVGTGAAVQLGGARQRRAARQRLDDEAGTRMS